MNSTSGHNLRSKGKITEIENAAARRPQVDGGQNPLIATSVIITKATFPHIRQKYDWDCGLVCCQMCLKWIHQPQAFTALTRRCPTQSTWSIDLAYLLHGFGIHTRYCTITWGADEAYKAIEYYKANLDSDASRVNGLFEQAASRGLEVEMTSLNIETIIQNLQLETCVIIILVDTKCFEVGCAAESASASASNKDTSHPDSSSICQRERLPQSIPSIGIDRGFVGHYVVLVAYDKQRDTFEVSDPGVAADRRCIKRCALDRARKQHGTDEDILLINVGNLGGRQGQPGSSSSDPIKAKRPALEGAEYDGDRCRSGRTQRSSP